MPYPEQINDLSVTVIPVASTIPGFNSQCILKVKNNGTTVINNIEANFTFNDEKLEYISSQGSSTLNGNTIVFDVGAIEPFTQKSYYIQLYAYEPPVNQGGDEIDGW